MLTGYDGKTPLAFRLALQATRRFRRLREMSDVPLWNPSIRNVLPELHGEMLTRLLKQSASSVQSGSATSSTQLLPQRQILQSEQNVHNFINNLEKVRHSELRTGQLIAFTNLFSNTRLVGTSL